MPWLTFDAIRFSGSSTDGVRIVNWVRTGVWADSGLGTRDIRSVEVPTRSGVDGSLVQTVNPGDWVYVLEGKVWVVDHDDFVRIAVEVNGEEDR